MRAETLSSATDNPVEPDGATYVPTDDLDLAVRVARATDRPLLLFGEPGSGKSSLAKYVAYKDRLRYYEHVITARTQPQDLQWSFDTVRRLGDAQATKKIGKDTEYVIPGALWWAFHRSSAEEFGQREPHVGWNGMDELVDGSVVLIDEIDKADPDLPNGLLVPLSGRYFTVTDIAGGQHVADQGEPRALIVITSNGERDLPPAFERRCVVYRLAEHDDDDLRKITLSHLNRPDTPGALDDVRFDFLLEQFNAARAEAKKTSRRPPSTAEFLDAVRACAAAEINNGTNEKLARALAMIFQKDGRGVNGLR